jgi:hypothetical protein
MYWIRAQEDSQTDKDSLLKEEPSGQQFAALRAKFESRFNIKNVISYFRILYENYKM